MRLQTLRIPDVEELKGKFIVDHTSILAKLTEVQHLYWREKKGVSTQKTSKEVVLRMEEGAVLGLNTYFNSFSCGKWKEYTEIKTVWFSMEGRGRFTISLYYAAQNREKAFKTRIMEMEINMPQAESCGVGPVSLSQYSEGSLYALIRANEPSEITGGGWDTDQEIQNSVCLAIVMCTYKKEAYVRRNLSILKELLDRGGEGVLSAVCIVDNGKTCSDPELSGVYVIPNENTGGSGGFIRGIKAILDREIRVAEDEKEQKVEETSEQEKGFTHLLLMDDDVVIEPEAIRRTKVFLMYMKKKYRMRLLGGAMLRLDYPYIQHEAGGVWNHGMIHSIHQGYDLRSMKQVLRNEQREKVRADYAAWWYCCIPLSYVRKYRLPMPYFLHCDDIEYSLRGNAEPIYLNGIAVWHEQFENKRSSAVEYYDVRNMLFTNQRHCPEYGWKEAAFGILYKVYANLIRYRYKDVKLVLRAVEDFRKGEEWLRTVDAEKLHEEIVEMGYRMTELKGAPKNKSILETELYKNKNQKIKRIINILTLNGYLLPAKHNRNRYIIFGAPAIDYFREKNIYFFDPNTGKGIVVTRDFREAFICVKKCIKTLINTKGYFNKKQINERK